jgi:hypothetical protein
VAQFVATIRGGEQCSEAVASAQTHNAKQSKLMRQTKAIIDIKPKQMWTSNQSYSLLTPCPSTSNAN